MMRNVVLGMLVVTFIGLVCACGGGIAPEAQAALGKHLSALQGKDKAAIAATVVPEQRKGALGLPAELGIKGDIPVKDMTLDDLLDVEFFHHIKTAKANADLAAMDDASTSRLGATIEYDADTSVVKSFVVKKTGDGWFVDVKATLEWWVKMDGGKALGAFTLKE